MAEIKLPKRYKSVDGIVKALLNRFSLTLEDVTEFVNSIEDADVVEVKHGEWAFAGYSLTGDRTYTCSMCGFAVANIDDVEMKYCGGCGAKMDRKEQKDG